MANRIPSLNDPRVTCSMPTVSNSNDAQENLTAIAQSIFRFSDCITPPPSPPPSPSLCLSFSLPPSIPSILSSQPPFDGSYVPNNLEIPQQQTQTSTIQNAIQSYPEPNHHHFYSVSNSNGAQENLTAVAQNVFCSSDGIAPPPLFFSSIPPILSFQRSFDGSYVPNNLEIPQQQTQSFTIQNAIQSYPEPNRYRFYSDTEDTHNKPHLTHDEPHLKRTNVIQVTQSFRACYWSTEKKVFLLASILSRGGVKINQDTYIKLESHKKIYWNQIKKDMQFFAESPIVENIRDFFLSHLLDKSLSEAFPLDYGEIFNLKTFEEPEEMENKSINFHLKAPFNLIKQYLSSNSVDDLNQLCSYVPKYQPNSPSVNDKWSSNEILLVIAILLFHDQITIDEQGHIKTKGENIQWGPTDNTLHQSINSLRKRSDIRNTYFQRIKDDYLIKIHAPERDNVERNLAILRQMQQGSVDSRLKTFFDLVGLYHQSKSFNDLKKVHEYIASIQHHS
ncbi:MAG: hypothetical protein P4L16_04100 [Chlamydiales bacterium]|nr:hypothetical protein [Chlamydiales bacterium]